MYKFVKLLTDIFVGACGFAVFLIAYIFIGAAIKIEDGGPVLVKLPRVSKGKTIQLFKFRSMQKNAQDIKPSLAHLNYRTDGPFFKIKDDPRITRVGKTIRRFRLDELPQFINVLRGELSVVGPRPHEPAEIEAYPGEYKFLAQEKSGITGLSQVMGASSLPFLKELELDAKYVREKNLLLDVKIILKTIAIMLTDGSAA